jgi:hypothetical protein
MLSKRPRPVNEPGPGHHDHIGTNAGAHPVPTLRRGRESCAAVIAGHFFRRQRRTGSPSVEGSRLGEPSTRWAGRATSVPAMARQLFLCARSQAQRNEFPGLVQNRPLRGSAARGPHAQGGSGSQSRFIAIGDPPPAAKGPARLATHARRSPGTRRSGTQPPPRSWIRSSDRQNVCVAV